MQRFADMVPAEDNRLVMKRGSRPKETREKTRAEHQLRKQR